MATTEINYIILLRAVNVSGKNIIKMADLRTYLAAAGFSGVQTYIQSGNIILRSGDSPDRLQAQVKQLILEQFGCTVEVFAVTPQQVEQLLHAIPWQQEMSPSRLFITWLDSTPSPELLASLQAIDHGNEQFEVQGNVLYFYLPDGMAKAKMNNSYFEKKLKVTGTGRNLNTFSKLLELARA